MTVVGRPSLSSSPHLVKSRRRQAEGADCCPVLRLGFGFFGWSVWAYVWRCGWLPENRVPKPRSPPGGGRDGIACYPDTRWEEGCRSTVGSIGADVRAALIPYPCS